MLYKLLPIYFGAHVQYHHWLNTYLNYSKNTKYLFVLCLSDVLYTNIVYYNNKYNIIINI